MGLDGFLCGSWTFDDLRVTPGACNHGLVYFDSYVNGLPPAYTSRYEV